PALVQTIEVTRGRVMDELRLTGSITPRRFTTVASELAARVEEVFVDAGDFVTAGDPLARLRSTPKELELAEEQAVLAVAQARLDQLLNGTRAEDLAIARANVADFEARLALAESDEKRLASLLSTEASSQSEYDRVLSTRDR